MLCAIRRQRRSRPLRRGEPGLKPVPACQAVAPARHDPRRPVTEPTDRFLPAPDPTMALDPVARAGARGFRFTRAPSARAGRCRGVGRRR